MTQYRSFEELDAWKRAREFKILIRGLCARLPDEEKYRLKDQMIRAARSVSANIAEGWGRYYFQENIQFCRIARGSLFEVLDHLLEAKDCSYLDEQEFGQFKSEFERCLIVLNGYIAFLKGQKQGK